VPEGGIGDVQIGLRGFTSGARGSHTADTPFPITNDPRPGPVRVVAPENGGGSPLWIYLLAAGSLCALAVALLPRWRRIVFS